MPNKTTKLQLNTFLENEVVDFEQINENFELLDALTMCTERGTKTASYTNGTSSTATWNYKKFSDNTVEMSAKLTFTNLNCNTGTSAPYYSSNASTISFPFSFSSIYDVQMSLSASTLGWISNNTSDSIINKLTIKAASITKETSNVYKQVFITVKGVLA